MPPQRTPGIKLDVLVQQSRLPVFALGSDRRFLFVNRAWEQLTGLSAEAVIGQECRPHGPTRPGDPDSILGSFFPPTESLAGEATSTLTWIHPVDAEPCWRRVEFVPLPGEENARITLLGLVRAVDSTPIGLESESHRLRLKLLELRQRLVDRHGFDTLIGEGSEHHRLLDQVAMAAHCRVPVLILGEVGTGKRTVARTIHQRGPRKAAPIVPFDCQALPPEVLERELFGVWTPSPDRPIRAPEGATLILSEILDLPRDLQGRLSVALGTHFRLIGTTTNDPDAAFRSERLRDDLYHALTTLVIRLRPLRERHDEIPLLAQHFLERANLRSDRPRDGFTPEALEALSSYDWPGNLRELGRVVIEHAHHQGDQAMIQIEDIPPSIRGARAGAYLPPAQEAAKPVALKDRLMDFERDLIQQALQKVSDNKSKAAKLLGVNRPYLYRRLKELGIAEDDPSGVADPAGEEADDES